MMKVITNNGLNVVYPKEAIKEESWDDLVMMMDDATREAVHDELAPCTNLEFLIRYLELAPFDLVIG